MAFVGFTNSVSDGLHDGNFRLSSILLLSCLTWTGYGSVRGDFERLSECSVRTSEGVFDLSPIKGILASELFDGRDTWFYAYSPCVPLTLPENPDGAFGDMCMGVAMCKYLPKSGPNKRSFYYNLGYGTHAEFKKETTKANLTEITITYKGSGSHAIKESLVKLICDRERRAANDTLFKVIKDEKKDLIAELRHIACCPDGYKNMKSETLGDEMMTVEEKEDHIEVDRVKVMIIVGVNLAVILMASCVGMMCTGKRAHREFYHKLPGVRNVQEPNLYQLTSSQDIEHGSLDPPGHMSASVTNLKGSAAVKGPAGPHKQDYRDGAPARRKSFIFPVLEHSCIPEECISLGQRLGGGLFGDTYLGEWTGITVAVKRVTLSVHTYQSDREKIEGMQNDIAFLCKQRHRNIVSLLGMCNDSKHPYVISEFIQGAVVKDFIKNNRETMTWSHRIKILSQIADGMAFIHSTSPPILHRDLRCGNLFITSNDVIKICDFGIVKLIQPLRVICQAEDCCCQGLYSACPASIGWTAPEVLEHPNSTEEDGYISTASDVYSYAILAWELVVCEDPYEEMHVVQEVIDHVVGGGRPEVPRDNRMFKPYLLHVQQCWHASPTERPNFKQITVQLKELQYQSKVFQKALSSHQGQGRGRSRSGQNSKTITFDDTVENI
ncbi:RAF proto-oncogene serine/threonine-protein kinase-like [Dreissena polymorpha]|uniref:Protein kinase domain-containing protein n=1 Tax=Dreissena polymorpha TaxID=45954 RepID=A0A9D4JXZ7_DREPO|nr:RAF proto-oncogene serine/threonine-protein kinase-like [Dreissena polymorpha]XP_052286308.1 RAF proto-oncogene serine/threonine-protein kinase-like [Dreissena polymorpha]KAH3824632.1 hypothetical protein DPMN_126469 [Dreissena polymorpha]